MGRGMPSRAVEVSRGDWCWLRESRSPRTPFSSLEMLCTESLRCWILSCWRTGQKSILRSAEGRKGEKGITDKP